MSDLKNSDGSCFILIIKRLFLSKSVLCRINLCTFSSIFGDLVVKLKIRKLQNCPLVKTRPAALAIVDYIAKLPKSNYKRWQSQQLPRVLASMQTHKSIEHCTDIFVKISVKTQLLYLR